MKGLSEKHIDLAMEYRKVAKDLGARVLFMSHDELLLTVINRPAPRFYISYEMAYKLVMKETQGIYAGLYLSKKRMGMYKIIVRRAKENMKNGMSIEDSIQRAIYSPAPSFYISLKRARNMITNIRKNSPDLLRLNGLRVGLF